MVTNQLQVELSAKINPLQKELKKVSKQLSGLDKETSNLSKSMNRSFSGTLGSIKKTTAGIAAAGYAAIKAVRAISDIAVDAIKVDAQADNLTRSMGKAKEAFLQWAHSGAAAFGIAEAAAIRYGNVYSGIVAQFETDGAQVAGITRSLIETAGVVASKSGRTTDDVLERIRSGLSGNVGGIEDLGIYVNQKTIEMSNAFMRIADGTPWSQLSVAQQSQIRTLAILEQAQRKYGTTVAETSAPLYLLKANLANLSLAWGRAFAPIAQFVIPFLNGLVVAMMTVANVIQKFTEKIFGVKKRAKETEEETDFSKMGSGLSAAANSAGTMGSNLGKANKQAKQLQRTLFGFDVIHNIEEPVEPADVGGGGGVGGMGGDPFGMPDFTKNDDDDSAGRFAEQLAKAQEMAEKLAGTLGKLALMIATVGGSYALWKNAGSIWDIVANSPLKYLKSLKLVATGIDYVTSLAYNYATDLGVPLFGVANKILNKLPTFGGAFIGFFKNLISKNLASVLWSAPKLLLDILGASGRIFGKMQIGVISSFTSVLGSLGTFAGTFFSLGKNMVSTIWLFTSETMATQGVLAGLFEGLKTGLIIVGELFTPVVTSVAGIAALIVGVGVAIYQLWNESEAFRNGWLAVWDSITNVVDHFMSSFFLPVVENFKDAMAAIVEYGLKPLWEGFKGMVEKVGIALAEMIVAAEPIVHFFIDYFAPQIKMIINVVIGAFSFLAISISKTMGKIFDNIGTIIAGIITVFKGIITFITGVFTGDWAKAWDGVKLIFSGMWNSLIGVVQLVWNTILGMFKAGGSIFLGIGHGILKTFSTIVNAMIRGINEVISKPFTALNNILTSIRGVSVMGMKPFGWVSTISVPQIPQFATGGFPEDGLFFANSNELVGKFTNGKTAVANNGQIIQGVSQGVAQAVSQVLGTQRSSGTQPINLTVQIGSETIAKETIKAIDDYTMRTGQTFKTV